MCRPLAVVLAKTTNPTQRASIAKTEPIQIMESNLNNESGFIHLLINLLSLFFRLTQTFDALFIYCDFGTVHGVCNNEISVDAKHHSSRETNFYAKPRFALFLFQSHEREQMVCTSEKLKGN